MNTSSSLNKASKTPSPQYDKSTALNLIQKLLGVPKNFKIVMHFEDNIHEQIKEAFKDKIPIYIDSGP